MSNRNSVICIVITILAACFFSNLLSCRGDGELDKKLRFLASESGFNALEKPEIGMPELVELGRLLFFDKILSGNKNISCATCHHPKLFTSDGLPCSIGEGARGLGPARRLDSSSRLIPRNSPALFNMGLEGVNSLFWDNRVHINPRTGDLFTPEPKISGVNAKNTEITMLLKSSLAAQAIFPVTSHDEMRGLPGSNRCADARSNLQVWAELVNRLIGGGGESPDGIEGYRALLRKAFPEIENFDQCNIGHLGKAIAAFEIDAFTTVNTPLDRFMRGDVNAMTTSQKRGGILFFSKAQCSKCHSGPHLSDFQAHALAVPQIGPGKNKPFEDLGLAIETGKRADSYKFRTPPLRNAVVTGPYMHDGAFVSLEDAVQHVLMPSKSLMDYNESKIGHADFKETLDKNPKRNRRRLQQLDPILGKGIALTKQEIGDLMNFLKGALIDPAVYRMESIIPKRVPSGLPVED
jgi:cytochrome c peroxidase